MTRDQAGALERRLIDVAEVIVADLGIDPRDVKLDLSVRLDPPDELITVTIVKAVE